ncbi:sugar phosphate isomerase/epimerase [Litorilinea aerophila]|uniref:Sugar phosphate isomerase/epimerase n=1 Tax=Litorilinea aerophila TaxID=1204385 RepID=A0A540VGJ3_9CHLR|nr:sugar phosphate isomerase/epimerase family protein [Litorilinea aerophila]MCC9076578.1 sugar phosphate isomerase/epimerase [Litorilinea aerophila]GIV79962.1 MAG: hypothetical protein KatS3mg050_4356 [Litorilinea sp.]
MEFGCCCRVEESEIAQAAGFDFIECTVVSLEPEQDEAAFAPILERYRAAALPVRAFNVFLPRDLKIVGPAVDWPRVERYVRTALQRVHTIGADRVVFGSGGARQVPDGFSRDEAVQQIVRFLRLAGEVAAPLGITIAIEPLNRRESNIINSVAEGVAFARQADHPAVRVLADFYHMEEEDEPLETLVENGPWLAHVHVADSGRLAPGTGEYPYADFVARLKEAGYGSGPSQRISVECRWRDFAAEAPAAAAFLRQAWG